MYVLIKKFIIKTVEHSLKTQLCLRKQFFERLFSTQVENSDKENLKKEN